MLNGKFSKRIVSLFLSILIVFNYSLGVADLHAETGDDVVVDAVDEPSPTPTPTPVPSDGLKEPANSYEEPSLGTNTIVSDLEAEKEYRESVQYVDNTVILSVLQYRAEGDSANYLTANDDLCKNHNLKDVEFLLEVKVTDVEQKDGYVAYQMFYQVTVNTDDVWAVVDELRLEEDILTAEPDFIWENTAEDDMEEVTSDELQNMGWVAEDLEVEEAWNSIPEDHLPGEGVIVAVIDTGVDYNHIDLAANMWVNTGEIPGNGIDDDGNGYIDDIHGINLIDPTKQGDPMDDHGHGTHVAGIIAMTPGNGGGVGLAYGAKIMAIKAGQANGNFASTDIAKAIQYAHVNGADVINMSLGGTGKSTLVEAALEDAFTDCVLVASAGNDSLSTTDNLYEVMTEDIYPAGYNYVLGVMASDANGNLAVFSNWDYMQGANCEYEMVAPGVEIYSTLPGNKYAKWSGTSMSAPMVSAAAAIIRRENTDKNVYTSRYIMGQLCSATEDIAILNKSYKIFTYPELNVLDSLSLPAIPNVYVAEMMVIDPVSVSSVNNGDGVIQPGETIDFGLLLFNKCGIASDVVVEVDAISEGGVENPYVEFITDSIEVDDIGTFASVNNGYVYERNQVVAIDNPIRVKISEDAPNDLQISFNVVVKYKNGMDTDSAEVYKNLPQIFTHVVQNGTYLRGVISEDMTLTSDRLWIVDRPVLIEEGVEVTVEPGTDIQFYSKAGNDGGLHPAYIYVDGTLNIKGSEANPVELYSCESYEDFVVQIKKNDIGTINASYAIIVNPDIKINNGDHLELYNNLYGTIYTINVTVQGITTVSSSTQRIYADCIKQSKISNLSSIFGVDTICDLDTVRCSNSYMNIGKESGNAYPFSVNVNNCVFINNYNDYRVASPSEYRNSMFFIPVFNKNIETSKYELASSIYGDFYLYKISNNAFLSDDYVLHKFAINCAYHVGVMNTIRATYHSDYVEPGVWDVDINGNYWGCEDVAQIENSIIHRNTDFSQSRPLAHFEEFLTLEDDMSSMYPFVTEAYVTDASGENRITQVANNQKVQIHVKFNRDMAQDGKHMPLVTYGGSAPYTDYKVEGDWVSAREWVGETTITAFVNQGIMYLRIKDAAAADDLWLTTGVDSARFSFEVVKTTAESITLQGYGGSNANYLNWIQTDYETLAGFNIYRSEYYEAQTDYSSGSFVKINPYIISNDTFEYVDTNVEQGVDYYYYFTVVDTDLNESQPSNIVVCRPIDVDSPMIISKVMTDATENMPITMVAEVKDNVKVEEVNLYYRTDSNSDWNKVVMHNTANDNYQGTIPYYDVKLGTIEYYFEASDGNNITYCGTEKVPNVINVVGKNGVDIETIFFENPELEITIGETNTLIAKVLPENSTDKRLVWKSSDNSVAEISDGVITAVGIGKTTVMVTSIDGRCSAICNVVVHPVYVETIDAPDSLELFDGDEYDLSPVIFPSNATIKILEFESSDEKVVTVDETGKIKTVGVGEAEITISTTDGGGLSTVCNVKVNPVLVQGVSVDIVDTVIELGDTRDLIASVYPNNATNKTVTWTSRNEKVATVEDGKITAVGVGSTTIVVTTEDGRKTAICNVTVVHANGHELVEDKTVPATCTEDGLTAGSHCSVCGEVIVAQEKIPATGHTTVVDEAVAPDCTHTGLTSGTHCSVCKEVLQKQTSVEALGHRIVLTEKVNPTCNSLGYTSGAYCDRCEEVLAYKTEIPMIDHTIVTDDAKQPTCNEEGLTSGSHCSVCGETLIAQKIVPITGHKYVLDSAVAPTCTTPGLTAGSHCSVCGEVIVAQEKIAAKGHTVVEDKAVEPTTEKPGKTAGSHCSVCGTIIKAQEEIPALKPNKSGIEGFCERLYTCALGRASDPTGVKSWVDAINAGATGAKAAEGFFFSAEIENQKLSNKEYVTRLYKTFMDREPDAAGLKAWVDALDNGATREQVFKGFVESQEWANMCYKYGIKSGGSTAPSIRLEPSADILAFAERLYTTCLGRSADPSGLKAWAEALANREGSGAKVAHGFFFSDEFIGKNLDNGEFVRRCYLTFMDREPDAGGYAAWVEALDKGATREQVFNGFTLSPEFVALCEKAGIIAFG